MERRRYRITGIVQGVGFRPFVHKLALKLEIDGWILNDSDGVVLEMEQKPEVIDSLIASIQSEPPAMARISSIQLLSQNNQPKGLTGFFIKESCESGSTETLVPPDANVCTDCLEELFDRSDRRYRYPFINCTNCGPRYSIIEDMPYDRAKTTMKGFELCPDCSGEYKALNDRRYHAQPVACPQCGPELELTDNQGKTPPVVDTIRFCHEKLLEGKVIAVKSIGGFHLVVNALDDQAVQTLRKRKRRDSKPFAIMVKDVETAEKYAQLCEEEKKLLRSVERPIVLSGKRKSSLSDFLAPANPNIGIMLPSAPLHYLLLENPALPALVMTSGNLSGYPIVYRNEEVTQLYEIADYSLLNNREIRTRVDDSIVRCSNHNSLKEPIITLIRRSRGFAPYPVRVPRDLSPILAFGAELKSTIALSKRNQVFISQHIGDLKNDQTFESLMECSQLMKRLLSIKTESVATDLHPHFQSTIAMAEQNDFPVMRVQHHHAHMAACMAENQLDCKAIGVIFDGTGYGLDGTIWGGEFLIGDYSGFERVGSLSPFFLSGGDKAIREPFRVALNLLYQTYGDSFVDLPLEFLKPFKKQELSLYLKVFEKGINMVETTSMGRFFDGISALLNLCRVIEYEAQAAIQLESLLNRQFDCPEPFPIQIKERDGLYEADFRPIVREIVDNLLNRKADHAALSGRFHATIVALISHMCQNLRERFALNDVVLSGGVFMNEFLLVNSVLALEKADFRVHYHKIVPTNDGGISLGQVMIADTLLARL